MANNELYYSNDGRGPLIARIIRRQTDGTVLMESKHKDAKHWHSFTINADFLDNSPVCGWKQRKPRNMRLPKVG